MLVPQDPGEIEDILGLQEPREKRETLVSRDQKEMLGALESEVILEKREVKDLPDLWDHLDQLDRKEAPQVTKFYVEFCISLLQHIETC